MNVLIVSNPFGGRDRGDRITDPDEIAAVLAGEHAHHVIQTAHADAPVPATSSVEEEE